ncbi:MAG: M1 family metallopeptidase [Cyclobacteriaceae bacterium]|nr:M1 family metallopeptidase [Cyclobacteriaceae bacterium]
MKIVDHHTFAKPEIAVITHLNWDADINFNTKTISAEATLSITKSKDAKEIILDINGLSIASIKDENGKGLTFEIGKEKPFHGSPLTVHLKNNTQKISIRYSTIAGAEALQWLNPKQTADEKYPFLFTQSQAILARSWVPIQDSPGIRFTYNAHVKVPEGMLALMSATNPTKVSDNGVYDFVMDKPIPAYLLALTVGDIRYQKLSERTGVYAEPSVIQAAAYEFADMEQMVEAAEKLYGPYQWEVYDLIVLPPSFPFGGMENPMLTFATPTILAGDRSLVSLVAHELAHSWSGNLVTNATWDDFWLNEGFTVYFEQRIMEAVYGYDYAEMLALLSLQNLKEEVETILTGDHPEDTKLKLNLEGRTPDDGMTAIAYDKGYYFLRLLEEKVGREKFDAFLKDYFTSNAFHSMTTEEFISQLNVKLFEKNGIPVDENLYNEWIFGQGLPANCPQPVSDRFTNVERVVEDWINGTTIEELFTPEDLMAQTWSSHEWLHFLRSLPEDLNKEKMAKLDAVFQFTYSRNSEILAAWMVLVIKHQYNSGYENLENFLVNTGRRKFLSPLYAEMAKTETGLVMAKAIYEKARPNYHFVASSTIDKMLDWKD